MQKPIDRAIAKGELERINQALREPHLLIGGLAVEQYLAARNSKDIDLVCEFETALELVESLYPPRDWTVDNKLLDEYRPSYQIKHRVEDLGTIIFGPKISERSPYDHIDWDALRHGASPFRSASGPLPNILIPTVHALAYTKFISFLGRRAPEHKVQADLKDFVNLTNHGDFSLSGFYDLVRKTGAFEKLRLAFREKSEGYRSIVEKSCMFDLSPMFSPMQWGSADPSVTVWIIGSVTDIPNDCRDWLTRQPMHSRTRLLHTITVL
jgi:hypothetical protein